MSGIKMSDCKFYVNEEKRTVVCVISNTKDLLIEFIRDNCINDLSIILTIDSDALWMPNSFIGKAVCAEEDQWNEELGRTIAFARAKDKCYRSFFKRANSLVQSMDAALGDIIEAFNNFGVKLEDNRITLTNRIESMMSKEE